MYQLVNLYQPIFRQQPKILSAVTLMAILATVFALLLALYVVAQTTMRSLQRTSADLVLSNTQLGAQLNALASVQSSTTDRSTIDQLDGLQAQIDQLDAVLQEIDSLFTDSELEFKDVFETLARTDLPGLWLTGVQLSDAGDIKISGTTLDPELVPRYLQRIAQQPALKPLTRGTVDLKRDDTRLPEVDFELSYVLPESEQ